MTPTQREALREEMVLIETATLPNGVEVVVGAKAGAMDSVILHVDADGAGKTTVPMDAHSATWLACQLLRAVRGPMPSTSSKRFRYEAALDVLREFWATEAGF